MQSLAPNVSSRSSLHAAQLAVLEVTIELIRLDHRLFEIVASLVLPADVDLMAEDKVAHDASAHLDGLVRYVKSDLLGEAIAALLKVTQVTDADLRHAFVKAAVGSARGGQRS